MRFIYFRFVGLCIWTNKKSPSHCQYISLDLPEIISHFIVIANSILTLYNLWKNTNAKNCEKSPFLSILYLNCLYRLYFQGNISAGFSFSWWNLSYTNELFYSYFPHFLSQVPWFFLTANQSSFPPSPTGALPSQLPLQFLGIFESFTLLLNCSLFSRS
jgi:hypothetical protein